MYIKPTRYLLSVHSPYPRVSLVPSSTEYRSKIPNLFYCQLSEISRKRNGCFVNPIPPLLFFDLLLDLELEKVEEGVAIVALDLSNSHRYVQKCRLMRCLLFMISITKSPLKSHQNTHNSVKHEVI